ncbi:MAG: pimeloyl-ACP methyl ester esterase BioH [Gammaproteobacteria bacterium]
MSLYVKTLGAGPDIVLLHGWGLHADIWKETAQRLASAFRVTLIDLPGHGRSAAIDGDFDLDALTAAVAAVAPSRSVWLGWSLGGMVSMRLAIEHPERVEGLILVASSPQFVRSGDWPHAMELQVLEAFTQMLEQDYHDTLQRFLALQTLGSGRGSETLRSLRELASRHSPPPPATLRSGLAILRDANLRPRLREIGCPVQLVFGQRDALVPLAEALDIKEIWPNVHWHVIKGAAHAPFLSHPDDFFAVVDEFLYEQIR